MKSSVTDLIETLIVLSDDDQPEVEKLAKESFDKLHKIFYGKNQKSLIELLEESFYVLLSRIPRFVRTLSKVFYRNVWIKFTLYFYYSFRLYQTIY